jgi:hypothetical protein
LVGLCGGTFGPNRLLSSDVRRKCAAIFYCDSQGCASLIGGQIFLWLFVPNGHDVCIFFETLRSRIIPSSLIGELFRRQGSVVAGWPDQVFGIRSWNTFNRFSVRSIDLTGFSWSRLIEIGSVCSLRTVHDFELGLPNARRRFLPLMSGSNPLWHASVDENENLAGLRASKSAIHGDKSWSQFYLASPATVPPDEHRRHRSTAQKGPRHTAYAETEDRSKASPN